MNCLAGDSGWASSWTNGWISTQRAPGARTRCVQSDFEIGCVVFDAATSEVVVPVLADRLQKLRGNFVLTKVAYQEKPTR